MKKYILLICTTIISIITITYQIEIKKPLVDTINYQVNEKDTYTPKSYNLYEYYLKYAKRIVASPLAKKETIEKITSKLKDKINNLQTKPNKTSLTNKYDELILINKDLYIPKSIPKLNQAIEKTKKVINDENALIEDVNNTIKLIDEAVNGLIIKPDKTKLIETIEKAKNIKDNNYTTKSFKALTTSISKAEQIEKNENATEEEVNNIITSINNDIKNLKKTTKGIYEIKAVNYMISNNHVGNEWEDVVYYNGKEVYIFEITAPYNSKYITLYSSITEEDNIPDYGSGSITILLKDGNTKNKKIYVTENRGRYYGNIAVWELECTITLKEKA